MTATDPHTTFAPPPGAKAAAVESERAHLTQIAARIDALRRRAEARMAETAADRSGSTFQAQFERDVVAHHQALRAARFTFGDVEALAFGRLDFADGEVLHVGKVSVVDEDGEVLLADWRAPAASAFYRATAAQPHGVARRRTLLTRGADVLDLDDEIIDADSAMALGLHAVTGQGALLAALTRDRSDTMRDIVATIQADQDAIVRAPARGILVVTGGPGTGKTVVALHRVAYLLYEDRERFEGRGVLVVGPSRAFTEYTARVLPSLGEDRAVQRALGALVPAGITVDGWDRPEVAVIKGAREMREVCHRAFVATMPELVGEFRISIDGTSAVLDAAVLDKLRQRQLDVLQPDTPGRTFRDRRNAALDALRDVLWKHWRRARQAQGGRVEPGPPDVAWRAALDASAAMTMLLRRFWPDRTAAEVLRAFAADPACICDVAAPLVGDVRAQLLAESWADADAFTNDDAALLDEIDALIGTAPVDNTPREDDPGLHVVADSLTAVRPHVDITATGYRDFAHVVVDEAQDLSAMQWRSLARRGPYASWTIVGDLDQRSRIGPPDNWHEIAGLIGRRHVEVHTLSVNYRTPHEIAEVARAVLHAAGSDTSRLPAAVRHAGERPRLIRTVSPLVTLAAVISEIAAQRDGTIGVVGMRADMAEIEAVRLQLATEMQHRVRSFDTRTVKGLEFDDVIIVHPDRIWSASASGSKDLYVAVTRATRTLTAIARPDVSVAGITAFATVDGADSK